MGRLSSGRKELALPRGTDTFLALMFQILLPQDLQGLWEVLHAQQPPTQLAGLVAAGAPTLPAPLQGTPPICLPTSFPGCVSLPCTTSPHNVENSWPFILHSTTQAKNDI